MGTKEIDEILAKRYPNGQPFDPQVALICSIRIPAK
jgi:hypothetical protein